MGELRSPGKLKHAPPMRRSRLGMPKIRIRAALGYATTYQTRQAFWLTMGWSALHENAFWNSGEFCSVPFTR
jgi:hypothetical protein